jgi:hypothetical protein
MRKEVRKKTGFSWIEFFKLTKLKVLFTFLFFLFLPFISFASDLSCNKVLPICTNTDTHNSIVFIPFFIFLIAFLRHRGHFSIEYNTYYIQVHIFSLIFSMILSYLISCLLRAALNKITKKKMVIVISIILLVVLASSSLFFPLFLKITHPEMINDHIQYGTACMNSRFTLNPVCYNNLTNELRIDVLRGPEDFVPIGIKLVLSTDKGNKEFFINKTSNSPQIRMNGSVYGQSLKIPDIISGEEYILKLSDMENISEVAIAAIVRIGNTEKICDITDRLVNIQPC